MRERLETPAPASSALAHPLDEFYRRAGLPLPSIETLPAERVPEPFHRLLVHTRDMTSTLEQFHQGRVHIEVLGREQHASAYYREVTLVVEPGGRLVEFGAIKINLDWFDEQARALILAERWPLGRILNDLNIAYVSRPMAFLRVRADALMRRLLKLDGAPWLFGRRNQLLNPAGQPLAEIVEILPPEPEGGMARPDQHDPTPG